MRVTTPSNPESNHCPHKPQPGPAVRWLGREPTASPRSCFRIARRGRDDRYPVVQRGLNEERQIGIPTCPLTKRAILPRRVTGKRHRVRLQPRTGGHTELRGHQDLRDHRPMIPVRIQRAHRTRRVGLNVRALKLRDARVDRAVNQRNRNALARIPRRMNRIQAIVGVEGLLPRRNRRIR